MKACLYRVQLTAANTPDFGEVLQKVADDFFSTTGHYENFDEMGIRIDHLKYERGVYTGDIIRQQISDLPPFAQPGQELQPSSTPIGHRCAFLYIPDTRVLIMESNKNCMGAGKFIKFVTSLRDVAQYNLSPILDQKTYEQLNSGNIRKITLKYAASENLEVYENDSNNHLANLERMRVGFSAPALEVTLGFDTPKRGHLANNPVVDLVRQALAKPHAVKKLVAKGENGDIINLLGGGLKFEAQIRLPSHDLADHYRLRRSFLFDALNEHSNFINMHFREAA